MGLLFYLEVLTQTTSSRSLLIMILINNLPSSSIIIMITMNHRFFLWMFVSYSQIIDDKQSMYVSSTCFWSRSTFHLICVVGEVLLLLLVIVTYIYNYYHYFRHMNNSSIGMVVKYVLTLLVVHGNDHLQQYAVSFHISKLFWYNLLISHNVE